MAAKSLYAQTGTYRLDYRNGASCTIAINKAGNNIDADVFAWWHTPSDRHGAFTGSGKLQNNKSILKSKDENSDCVINLDFIDKNMVVRFSDCMFYNLPEDFSGNFKWITDKTPGNYIVMADRSYFYKKTNKNQKQKTYLVKGNKIEVDLENISDKDWVFINYSNNDGKNTSGYMLWSDMKKI